MNYGFRLIVRDESGERTRNGPGLWFAVADFVLIIALLITFAYFHHGRVEYGGKGIMISPRDGAPYVITDTFKSADNGGDVGLFDFADRFAEEAPVVRYQNETVVYADGGAEIELTEYEIPSGSLWAADIYLSDITRLTTALANDFYGFGQREGFASLARRHDAIFAMTGDNYTMREGGAVLRNGVLYSKDAAEDVCVLGWDGTLTVYGAEEFDLTAVMNAGAYQMWSCGPCLVADGEITEAAVKDRGYRARRAAIGCCEPGHYCMVMTGGNVSLEEIAWYMKNLGCESAYNLCGQAAMFLNGKVVGPAGEDDIRCGDIVMITK